MSKYSLQIYHHWHRQLAGIAGYLLAIGSIFLWQPRVVPFQLTIQCSLGLILAGLMYTKLRRMTSSRQKQLLIVDEQGYCQWLGSDGPVQWKIMPTSRIGWGFVYLQLQQETSPQKVLEKWYFSKQFSTRHFRRLCRVVLRAQTL